MSPWAKIEKPEPVKLEDIMSEEVARELQIKEDNKLKLINQNFCSKAPVGVDIPSDILKDIYEDDNIENDEMIAKMLQIQYDKEYDEELKRTENKFNGSSKVSISFDNYRRTPLNDDFVSDSSDEEIIDIRERKVWDRFETLEREFASIPQCGYKMKSDGNMVTKHDVTMSGRKDACKLLSFPPEFQTGDGENFDLKLSNKVFNSLKKHSKQEQTRIHKNRDKKEDHATAIFGLDQFTHLLLYKMINNQLLETVDGIISTGKEAVVLHAESDPSFPFDSNLPKELAIKVFKTTLAEFKQRDEYIRNDHRFKERVGKQRTRNIVHLWAEKEMANLVRIAKANIPCPQVVTLKHHVLVMSFIGENHIAAPKLHNVHGIDYSVAYKQVVEGMKKLYNEANLIHADLSEYNILWYKDRCYFIDVSQAVEPNQQNSFRFLYRDCTNISHFFSKKGVPEVLSPGDLFIFITGYDYGDKLALSKIQETFIRKPHLVDRPGIELPYNFDTAWDESKSRDLSSVDKILSEVDLSINKPMPSVTEEVIVAEPPKA